MPWGMPFPEPRRAQLERAALAGDVISARMLRDDLDFPAAIVSLAKDRGWAKRPVPSADVVDLAAVRATREDA